MCRLLLCSSHPTPSETQLNLECHLWVLFRCFPILKSTENWVRNLSTQLWEVRRQTPSLYKESLLYWQNSSLSQQGAASLSDKTCLDVLIALGMQSALLSLCFVLKHQLCWFSCHLGFLFLGTTKRLCKWMSLFRVLLRAPPSARSLSSPSEYKFCLWHTAWHPLFFLKPLVKLGPLIFKLNCVEIQWMQIIFVLNSI